jgi:hypothetical protein
VIAFKVEIKNARRKEMADAEVARKKEKSAAEVRPCLFPSSIRWVVFIIFVISSKRDPTTSPWWRRSN